jgi:Rab guanine nucleotide exchange factor SEC2
MGGGVVPVHHIHSDASRSPRVSEDERKEQERRLSEELERTGEIQPKDITPVPETVDVTKSPKTVKRTSGVTKADTAEGLWEVAQEDAAVPSPNIPEGVNAKMPEEVKVATENRDKTRDSTQSTSSLQVAPGNEVEKDGAKRLSITIPGSFE